MNRNSSRAPEDIVKNTIIQIQNTPEKRFRVSSGSLVDNGVILYIVKHLETNSHKVLLGITNQIKHN